MASAPVLQIGGARRGWWPGLGGAAMYAIFGGIALMGILATAPLVPRTPVLLFAWVAVLAPLGVVWVILRLIDRHAIRLWDSDLEIVQPFKTQRLAMADIAEVQLRSVLQGGSGMMLRWLYFGNAEGETLAFIAASAFPDREVDLLIEGMARAKPGLRVTNT